MNGTNVESIISAWKNQAKALAYWTIERLLSRDDYWGGYGDQGVITKPVKHRRGRDKLSVTVLSRHYAATCRDEVIGLHFISAYPRCETKSVAIDYDNKEKLEAVTLASEADSILRYEGLRGLGFTPLLTNSGHGSIHLRVLLDKPIPSEIAYDFSRWLFRGFTGEVFPKQRTLTATGDGSVGSWLRLPGRHHKRDSWSTVWNGEKWLEGEEAIAHILSLVGDDPAAAMEEYYVFAREAAEAAEAAQDETRRAFDADERTRPAGDYETEDGRHRRFGQGALRAACKIILSAPNGEKHKILYRMSAWMGDLIANYFLNESECAAELLRSILTRGDVEDVRSAEKTILDGLCKGQTNPRPRLPPNPVAPKVIFGKGSKEAVTTVDDDQEDEEDDGAGLNGCQIILRYFRRTYRPIFRRSNTIRCRAGGDVPMAVACAVPNSKLIGQLAAALDAPTYKGGGVNLNALPSFFGSWAKVAWGDLLSELTDEHNYIPKNEKEMASSREEFRIMVRAAMLTEVVIGETIGGEGHTQTERRSLVEWCQRFAKAGPWRAVRSKRCWCKFIERDDGEIIQMVAIRSDIFGQLKADKSLCSLSANRFGRLAKLYGVGESTDENRPEGLAVVVLSQDFLREISGSPHEES